MAAPDTVAPVRSSRPASPSAAGRAAAVRPELAETHARLARVSGTLATRWLEQASAADAEPRRLERRLLDEHVRARWKDHPPVRHLAAELLRGGHLEVAAEFAAAMRAFGPDAFAEVAAVLLDRHDIDLPSLSTPRGMVGGGMFPTEVERPSPRAAQAADPLGDALDDGPGDGLALSAADAEPATRTRRLLASTIDAAAWLVLLASTSPVAPLVGALLRLDAGAVAAWRPTLATLLGALVLAGVQAWLLATRGQSLGKLAARIHVVRDDDGEAPGWVRGVAIRGVAVPLVYAIPAIGVGALVADAAMMLVRRDRRALHDRVAGTRVLAD
ncbi:MAG: RDD family protein [Burkholderiales bacterium]